MKKILILILLTIYLNATNNIDGLITSRDVAVIEKGILKEAIARKNYNDITSIGISFFSAAQNGEYSGDRIALKKRALELLYLSVNNYNVTATNFLVLNYLKSNPKEAHKIAKKIITRYLDTKDKEYWKQAKGIVMMFVSLTLDNYSTNIEEVNFALQALESIKTNDHLTNFYKAFLFKAIDSDELADMFLNAACDGAKEKKIVDVCKGFEL